MKFYQSFLEKKNINVNYIDAQSKFADIRKLIPWLKESGIEKIYYIDTSDDWLEKRIKKDYNKKTGRS